VCEQLDQGRYLAVPQPGVEPATLQSPTHQSDITPFDSSLPLISSAVVWSELDSVSDWVLFAFLQGSFHSQCSFTLGYLPFPHILQQPYYY